MNLVDVLDGRGIAVRRSGKPNEIWICCPFCPEQGESPDSRFRLGINVETGWAHCFNGGCNWGTKDPEYLVQEINRALQTGLFDLEAVEENKPVVVKWPHDFQKFSLDGEMDYWEKKAYRYAKKRKIADWQLKRYKIGFCVSGNLGGRIIIPIIWQGKLRGLVGRDFTGKQDPPYKNSLGDKWMFGVPKEKQKTGVIMEGTMDALAVQRAAHGEWDSLGANGHTLTDNQLGQLKGYKKIVLWPDPDAAGITGFLGMVPNLEAEITRNIWIVEPKLKGEPDLRDPDEYGLEERRQKVLEAKPLSEEREQRLRAWVAFQKEED